MGDINGNLGVRSFFFFSLCVSVCLTILFILFTNRLWTTTNTVKFRGDPSLSTADLMTRDRQEATWSPPAPDGNLAATASPLSAEDRESVPDSPSQEDEPPEELTETSRPSYLYLPACDSCGLGTTLFQFASAYGVAKRNKMGLLVSPSFGLLKVFGQLDIDGTMSEQAVNSSGFKALRFEEESVRVYNPEVETLHNKQQNWTLGASRLQSWKYFQDYERDIRRQFTFCEDLKPKVESFLTQAAKLGRVDGATNSSVPSVFVGVHVRRTGLTDGYEKLQGDLVAAEWYLTQAMSYYRETYGNVTFVVCSDVVDMEWCKSHIATENNDVVFSEGHTAVEDLAILAACNHTVVTLGAFGWWGGWLAGGEVVYYRGWYIKESNLGALLTGKDYMLPEWKGMG